MSQEIEHAAITRTHQALGSMPFAILVGAGDRGKVMHREFSAHVTITGGGTVAQTLEMTTESPLGLPRGNDPMVLLALLHLLVESPSTPNTNKIAFRKAELLKILGWTDTPRARLELGHAIERYYRTNYRGINLWNLKTRRGRREQNRRLIIGYEVIDERALRYGVVTGETDCTWVAFDPDFVGEVRESGFGIDIQLYMRLRTQLARRLFEHLSYYATEVGRDFDFDVRLLAHSRLGLSKKLASPAQCWAKVSAAFETLLGLCYLNGYDYDGGEKRVRGSINPKHILKKLLPLAPLPSTKKEDLLRRVASLRTRNAGALLDRIPDDALDDVELIVAYIERDRALNPDRVGQDQQPYNWGGWVYKAITTYLSTGVLEPMFLEMESAYAPAARALPVAPGASQAFDPQAVALNISAMQTALDGVAGMLGGSEAALAEAIRGVARRLELIAKRVSASSTLLDPQSLEDELSALDAELDRALCEALQPLELAGVRGRAEENLKEYRRRMDGGVYEQTLENMVGKLLREERGLPKLTLFSL